MQNVPLPLFGHAEFRKLAGGMWKMTVQDRKTQAPKRKFGGSSPLYTFLEPERTTLIIHSELSLISV